MDAAPTQSLRYFAGRSPDAHVRLDDASVSGCHAFLYVEGGRIVIADNASANGVFVNAARVSTAFIEPGMHVHLGSSLLPWNHPALLFLAHAAAASRDVRPANASMPAGPATPPAAPQPTPSSAHTPAPISYQAPMPVMPVQILVGDGGQGRQIGGQEISFYSDTEGVRVTNSRLIVGSSTYAMANLTSVRLQSKGRAGGDRGRVLRLTGGSFTIVFLLLALHNTLMNDTDAARASDREQQLVTKMFEGCMSLVCLSVGAGLLLVGFMMRSKSTLTHVLTISTSGGEVDVLTDAEPQRIARIAEAINQSLMHRG